ncbi:flagellar basal body rod C-terminal domain-containing protein [Helicobacter burdigaliensis]|uniref:flagellar basal body rod C-terminal domain-containing protein n=1 Tax=Helicobacter burdigaliensis TaxID=2315334 RepID=UPI000EF650A4|nr:flagellar basal body rod C-terminal domain-containing protein [Helicobacter burdigaliensis]
MEISKGFDYANAFSNAQNGINSNMQILQNSLETSQTDLAQSSVDNIVSQNGVEANAKVVQSQDSMMQSLLDLMA